MSFHTKYQRILVFILISTATFVFSQEGIESGQNKFFQQIKSSITLMSTVVSDTGERETIVLNPGSYIRPLPRSKETPTWAMSVLIVDSSNRVVDNNPYFLARTWYNKVTSEKINKTINLIREQDNSSLILNLSPTNPDFEKFQDMHVSVIEDSGKWYYVINLTNSEGETLDHKGNVVSAEKRPDYNYRASRQFVNKAIMENNITYINNSIKKISTIGEIIRPDCEPTIAPISDKDRDPKFPGCESLKKPQLTLEDETKLNQCLISIKNFIVNQSLEDFSLNRTKAFKAMYQLPDYIRDFAGRIFTAQGEAGIITPPLEEMMMVMKVIDNRVKFQREKGKDVELLDIVLQRSHFSMYNAKDPGWKKVLVNKNNQENESNAIKAFIMHKKTDYPSNTDQIYHYLANYVYNVCATEDSSRCKREREIRWFHIDKDKRIDDLIINNVPIRNKGKSYHMFYSNVAWGYSRNEFKP